MYVCLSNLILSIFPLALISVPTLSEHFYIAMIPSGMVGCSEQVYDSSRQLLLVWR